MNSADYEYYRPTAEDLKDRVAKCHCNRERPSIEALNGSLAFFEYRGPKSEVEKHICAECRFHYVAHTKEGMARNVATNRKTVIERGECTGFKKMVGGYPTDTYYCGCRGWD